MRDSNSKQQNKILFADFSVSMFTLLYVLFYFLLRLNKCQYSPWKSHHKVTPLGYKNILLSSSIQTVSGEVKRPSKCAKICLCELSFSRITEQPSPTLSGYKEKCRLVYNLKGGHGSKGSCAGQLAEVLARMGRQKPQILLGLTLARTLGTPGLGPSDRKAQQEIRSRRDKNHSGTTISCVLDSLPVMTGPLVSNLSGSLTQTWSLENPIS